ncbi:MAG TPA: hypothetical protein DEH11_05545, partial [Actinobacteria bacterium]|nr:hypothetical protein [Actinomycetota bacterium]
MRSRAGRAGPGRAQRRSMHARPAIRLSVTRSGPGRRGFARSGAIRRGLARSLIRPAAGRPGQVPGLVRPGLVRPGHVLAGCGQPRCYLRGTGASPALRAGGRCFGTCRAGHCGQRLGCDARPVAGRTARRGVDGRHHGSGSWGGAGARHRPVCCGRGRGWRRRRDRPGAGCGVRRRKAGRRPGRVPGPAAGRMRGCSRPAGPVPRREQGARREGCRSPGQRSRAVRLLVRPRHRAVIGAGALGSARQRQPGTAQRREQGQ